MPSQPNPNRSAVGCPENAGLSAGLAVLIAVSCGATAANLYFAQPLIGLIGPDLRLPVQASSLIVTLSQLGYGLGLVLLVPLGDLIENKRLIVVTLGAIILMLGLAAAAPSATPFLVASLLVGITSVAAQMLVPFAATLAPEARRGRVVGNVMSGLLFGILLARPVASLIADRFGWRAPFAVSAVLTLVLAVLLARALPRRHPRADHSYGELLGSLWTLLKETPVLRRRAAYQSAMFGAFSLFWTAVPLQLAQAPFHLTQRGIGAFALAGAAGALIAPVAGRMADRGWGRVATGGAMLTVLFAAGLSWIGAHGSIVVLVIAAVLLDAGVQCCQVSGQREIYALASGVRNRLNGLYIAIFFMGGAFGSALAGPLQARGWGTVTLLLAAFPIAALLFYATERVPRPRRVPAE